MRRTSLLLLPVMLSCSVPVSVLHADGGFYGDPPDATHPWAIHDANRPQPVRVEPGTFSSQQKPGQPPADAIVLFDGTEAAIANWVSDKKPAEPTKWVVRDGALECVPKAGYIQSKLEFGDCQLHIEWSAPSKVEGNSQGRGNSGVFLMGQVEVQVLDNFENPTYADGFAGSVYGVNPPMANPLHKPGEWQVYDIVFRRPVFKGGQLVDPGYLTVFVNGVLVQDHTPLEGGGGHKARSKPRPFPEKGPLKLQDHGNPVRYRNIWYRPLPPRAIEGGDTSVMSEEATTAKRAEIARGIREDAAKRSGQEKMLRLLESLCYQQDASTQNECTRLLTEFVDSVKSLSGDSLNAKKGEIMQVHSALQYMKKFSLLPDDYAATGEIAAIVKKEEWEKKK